MFRVLLDSGYIVKAVLTLRRFSQAENVVSINQAKSSVQRGIRYFLS
jgi:hypothetical protein